MSVFIKGAIYFYWANEHFSHFAIFRYVRVCLSAVTFVVQMSGTTHALKPWYFLFPKQHPKTESETCWYNSHFAKGQTTCLQKQRKTLFNQELICKKIQHMLDSNDNLGAGGKHSASTVFDTIIHITLLKYFKSLVTCDLLLKWNIPYRIFMFFPDEVS